MKTAEERYEETWNSYLELLNKDPRASLVSFTKLKSVYYRGMTVQASIVTMIEPETMSEQERTVVMIADKDDSGDGYFVDIFRSRHGKESKEGPEFHDYFYHNLGQQMTMAKEDGDELAMEKTEELAFAGAHLYAYLLKIP